MSDKKSRILSYFSPKRYRSLFIDCSGMNNKEVPSSYARHDDQGNKPTIKNIIFMIKIFLSRKPADLHQVRAE